MKFVKIFIFLFIFSFFITTISLYFLYINFDKSHSELVQRFAQRSFKDAYIVVRVLKYVFFEDFSIGALKFLTSHLFIESLKTLAIKSFVVSFLMFVAFYYIRESFITRRHVRGARFMTAIELKNELKKEKSRLKIANIPFPISKETQGIFVLGMAGTGKTVSIKSLLEQVFDNSLPTLIYDRKPDFTNEFYRKGKDLLLYPYDRNSVEWNIFADIRENFVLQDVDFICYSLIPPTTGENAIFDNASRDILKCVFLKVYDSEDKTMEYLINFVKQIANLKYTKVYKELEETANKYGIGIKNYLSSEKLATSVLSNFFTLMNNIAIDEFCHRGDFSIRKFIERGNVNLFVVNKIDTEDRLRAWYRTLFNVAIKHLLSMPEDKNRRRVFVIDEFQSLGQLEALEIGITEGRSKGFFPIIATQSLAQVEKIYGKEKMRSIFQSIGTKVIHRYEEPEGTKFLSDWIGEEVYVEKEITYDNQGRETVKWVEKTKRVLLPSDFTKLKVGEAILKISDYDPVKVKFPHKRYERIYEFESVKISGCGDGKKD